MKIDPRQTDPLDTILYYIDKSPAVICRYRNSEHCTPKASNRSISIRKKLDVLRYVTDIQRPERRKSNPMENKKLGNEETGDTVAGTTRVNVEIRRSVRSFGVLPRYCTRVLQRR